MNTTKASSDPHFWNDAWRAVRALWHSANHKVREGAQCVTYSIIGAFALLLIAAMSGSGFFVSSVALIALAAGAILLVHYPNPLIIIPIAMIPGIEKVWRALKSLLGAYFFLSIFLMLGAGAIRDHWQYVPQIALTALGALVFQWIGWNARAVWAGAIAVALVLFVRADGIKQALASLDAAFGGKPRATQRQQAPPPQEYIVSAGDGVWAPPPGTREIILTVNPMGGKFTHWIAPPEGMARIILPRRIQGNVQMQFAFANGTAGSPFWRGPMQDIGQTMSPVTGVRFSASSMVKFRLAFEDETEQQRRSRGFMLQGPPRF